MSAILLETWQDLITLALKNAGVTGVGQTASATDSNDACLMLNAMIAQWQRRRYLIYHLVELSVPSTGAQSYSIGPGGDFSVAARPAAINAAFARQTITSVPNQIDYPLEILPSRETYSQIAMKSLQSFPRWCWYDAGFPMGQLLVYPVVQPLFEIHIVIYEVLNNVTSLTGAMSLPGEYQEALLYNLALRLAANYNSPINPIVPGLAKASLETIRVANAQIPRMNMPRSLSRRPSRYNIFSDN
jgi:hypothetical protein